MLFPRVAEGCGQDEVRRKHRTAHCAAYFGSAGEPRQKIHRKQFDQGRGSEEEPQQPVTPFGPRPKRSDEKRRGWRGITNVKQ